MLYFFLHALIALPIPFYLLPWISFLDSIIDLPLPSQTLWVTFWLAKINHKPFSLMARLAVNPYL